MTTLFDRPKGLKFTDMAIWIDNNFYKPDCDYNKAYKYMYLLAYMLACKSKYFKNTLDYEGYAAFLAYCTFERMKKSKIKSVLNYMKSIKYFRKIAYEETMYSEMIDTNFDQNFNSDKLIENTKTTYERNKRDILELYINDSIESFNKIILNNIPKIYLNKKLIYKRIYISCMLSFIDRITLPKILGDRANLKSNIVDYYTKHLDNESVKLWHLDDSYKNIIIIILNKSYKEFIDLVKDTIDDIKVSDKEMGDIWSSGFDINETDS